MTDAIKPPSRALPGIDWLKNAEAVLAGLVESGERWVVQPWDGQGYAVVETRNGGLNPSNGMVAYFNRRIHEPRDSTQARAEAFAALSAPLGTAEPGVEELAKWTHMPSIREIAEVIYAAEFPERTASFDREPYSRKRVMKYAAERVYKMFAPLSRALTARDAALRRARENIQMLRRDWTAHPDDYTNGLNDALAILDQSVAEGEKG